MNATSRSMHRLARFSRRKVIFILNDIDLGSFHHPQPTMLVRYWTAEDPVKGELT